MAYLAVLDGDDDETIGTFDYTPELGFSLTKLVKKAGRVGKSTYRKAKKLTRKGKKITRVAKDLTPKKYKKYWKLKHLAKKLPKGDKLYQGYKQIRNLKRDLEDKPKSSTPKIDSKAMMRSLAKRKEYRPRVYAKHKLQQKEKSMVLPVALGLGALAMLAL